MNDQICRFLATVLVAIERFEKAEINISDAQQVVDSVSRLLDRNSQTLVDELRDCETDLEFIRFAIPDEQQRDAALRRLQRTKDMIGAKCKLPDDGNA